MPQTNSADIGRDLVVSYDVQHSAMAMCRGIVAELWIAHPDRK